MSRLKIDGQWTTIEKLEKEFGFVEFEGKKYILTMQADFTNRQMPSPRDYNDVLDNEEYDFEMSASAVDENENNYTVYWIFTDIKGENGKELDSFDYDKVNRVIE